MCDEDIIALFFERSEKALEEVRAQYGRLIQSVSYSILHSTEDAEECENDVYLRAWESIPPTKPEHLSAYLCVIARRTAINRYKYNHAAKRGEDALPLEELSECIRGGMSAEDRLSEKELSALLNDFLEGQDVNTRVIFMRRFWLGENISQISARLNVSDSMVKSRISRTLKKLRGFLESHGYSV